MPQEGEGRAFRRGDFRFVHGKMPSMPRGTESCLI